MSSASATGDHSDTVYISSDSEVARQEDEDDLFEVRGAPTEEDLKLAKKEPSPKRGNDTEALKLTQGEQCSICLQPFDVVTVLSGCYHRFCFACILHWSQVSPTCPLCKRPLGYLMYDITADGQYRTFYPKDLNSSAPARSQLLDKFPTEAHRRRKAVYTKRLERLPVPKKKITAQQQPLLNEQAWEKRIEPWVKRELQAVLSEEDVSLVLLLTRSLVLKFGTSSAELSISLRDFLFEHTDTFISELDSFISSSLDVAVYDRLVEYQNPSSASVATGEKRRQADQ